MSKTMDEESLDNPTNIPPENSPDEIMPDNDTKNFNLKEETGNMEVHHHSHGHEKKNWKSYFWEFLMLFLAVFCGFLAEYQLEHVIEQQRAKVFAVSMLDDLIADTTQLIEYKKRVSYDGHNVDTLFKLLAQADPKDIPTGKLYWYGLF